MVAYEVDSRAAAETAPWVAARVVRGVQLILDRGPVPAPQNRWQQAAAPEAALTPGDCLLLPLQRLQHASACVSCGCCSLQISCRRCHTETDF
jgi:hypothetical protein